MSAEKPKPPPASGLAEPFFLAIRKSQIQKHENFLLGAFAELIDNASEALATTLKIDIDHEQTGALFFLDNGIGMDRGTIRTLLTELNNTTKVGGTNYGVGFKTGAFNLGEEILVLSKTYECGPRCTYRKDTLEGTSSAVCACCGKKDDRTLKVAMVFWDREGRAITAIPEGRNLRDSLPGSDGEIGPIKVDDVEQEIKWITKYSRLHTIGAVQKYFDKIPGCGTLILLCPLPDVANSKEVVFEPNAASGERSTDIILR
ncbi:hypothetical protein T484DRAFT_1801726 [Baffinella frigidus]|nr:hypothetical protein T484DRAFT_1801726 [Cryptophyta sp. CCMP2293]